MVKRILSFFLSFSIVISMLSVVAFAARPSGNSLIRDGASIDAWNTWLDINIRNGISSGLIEVSEKNRYWAEIDKGISASGVGACSDYESLIGAKENWNGCVASFFNLFDLIMHVVTSVSSTVPTAEIAFDSDLGVYRLREYWSKLWLVNSSGHFPYYRSESPNEVEHIGQWRREDAIKDDQALWHVVIGADLSAYQENWADERSSVISRADGDYYWLVSRVEGIRYVLCDDYGYPYYVPIEKETAVTTPNNYYTEEGDSYTDESTNVDVNVYDNGSAVVGEIIDVDNGILNVGGEIYYIDDLTYDASSKTYFVDSHDAYTFNSTTNNYTTNNYRWEIQYNIDYTSVTYIGQTSEYEERYEYYYQLPDGRSSADLTAEDLEQLSVVFSDVIQYERTTDNVSQRALYHLDGNTEDSSYWSYASNFDWSSGATLTYMDEGTFNGSMYLDETEHDFTITLPGNDAAGDWTLQFRYYQSHTEAPVYDSYVMVGDHVVLRMNGSHYMTKGDVEYAAISTGVWNEICIIRSEGHLYYYINGVYLSRSIDQQYHSNTINFHFGSEQQTYKKIDELRFTSTSVYLPGVDYVPSVVPYDSNLTLVLPGSGSLGFRGLKFITSENNLLSSSGVGDWSTIGVVKNLTDDMHAYENGEGADGHHYADIDGGVPVIYNPDYVSFSERPEGGVTVNFKGSGVTFTSRVDGHVYSGPSNTLFIPFAYLNSGHVHSEEYYGGFGLTPGKTYCFTIVLADGSYLSRTVRIVAGAGGTSVLTTSPVHDLSSITVQETRYGSHTSDSARVDPAIYGLTMYSNTSLSLDILYMELVEGSSPQFKVVEVFSEKSSDPDVGSVIPDEVIHLTTPRTGNLLKNKGLASWTSISVIDRLDSDITAMKYHNSYEGYSFPDTADGLQLLYNPDVVSFSDNGNSVLVDFGSATPLGKNAWTDYGMSFSYYPDGSLFLPVSHFSGYCGENADPLATYYLQGTYGFSKNVPYTLTVFLADGSSSSVTFTVDSSGGFRINSKIDSAILFDFARVGLACDYYYDQPDDSQFYGEDYDTITGILIYPSAGSVSVDILHMELAQSSVPLTEASRSTSLYSAADLTSSPVLAVRTNRPISSYQLGGVRPSYPTEGQVYGMVENNRITSLQQYTGYIWEAVDGRIWTGSRWIPYGSFDVKTLQDLYDVIGTTDDYEYIYSESGFWSWFQRAWSQFMAKIDMIIEKLDQLIGLSGEHSDCEHVYVVEENKPTCSEPGGFVGTCENCGHIELQELPALGHDWIQTYDCPSKFVFSPTLVCSKCSGSDFTCTNYDSVYEIVEFICNDCNTEFGDDCENVGEYVVGYTLYYCSRCKLEQYVSKDEGSNNFFGALGNFLVEGIVWVSDKLYQLIQALHGILDSFESFAARIKDNVGQYPAFLAAAVAVLPSDLMDTIWFAVIALIAVAVYKKLTR